MTNGRNIATDDDSQHTSTSFKARERNAVWTMMETPFVKPTFETELEASTGYSYSALHSDPS